MEHSKRIDPVTKLIAQLFSAVAGRAGTNRTTQPATPKVVARRAAKRLKQWPDTLGLAIEFIADESEREKAAKKRKKKAQKEREKEGRKETAKDKATEEAAEKKDKIIGWTGIQSLGLSLRNEVRKRAKDDVGFKLSLDDENLFAALYYGPFTKLPRKSSQHTYTCDICWRPGWSGKLAGNHAYLCSDHRADQLAGQRLIRIAKKAGGWGALKDEVMAARQSFKHDYAALACAREKYSRSDPDWAAVHRQRGMSEVHDDHFALLAVAWDHVDDKYSRELRRRDTAGRPRAWTDDQIIRAAKGNGRLREKADRSGIPPATLSRRLSELTKSQPSQT